MLLAVTFAVAVRQSRHSVIDTVWGLGFVVVAAISWFLSAGHGDGGRRLLLLALVAVWGIRLAVHIGLRARGGHEDPRYVDMLSSRPRVPQRLRAAAGLPAPGRDPVLRLAHRPGGDVQHREPRLAGAGWASCSGSVGFVFETVGDWQLAQFKADPARRGTVLDTGLWRYTRHPNYFGDAAVWAGLFLVAADSWPGVLTVLSPALMIWTARRQDRQAADRKGHVRPPRLQGIRRIHLRLPAPGRPGGGVGGR